MEKEIDKKIIEDIKKELKRIKGISGLSYKNIKFEADMVIDAYKNLKELPDYYVEVFLKHLKDATKESLSEFDSLWIEYRAAFYISVSTFINIGMPDYYVEKYMNEKKPESINADKLRKELDDNIINNMERNVKLHPFDPQLRFRVGMEYFGKGRYPEAASHIKQAKWNDQQNVWYYYHLACIYKQMGREHDSLNEMMEGLNLERTNHFNLHYKAGEFYEEMGKLDLALMEYRIANNMNPSNNDAWKKVEELKKKLGYE